MDDVLISRQKLKDAMYHEAFEKDSDDQKWDSGCWIRYRMFERIINSIPTARKKGKWIYGENSGQDGWYCSECGGFIPWYYDFYGLDNIDFIEDFKTCPFCDSKMVSYTGADMREGEEE